MSKNNEMPVQLQDLAGLAQGRSSFYAFLNMHFMSLPDADFIRQMRVSGISAALKTLAIDPDIHPEIADGWRKMGGFLEETGSMPVEGLAETLGVDRTHLYRGVSGTNGPPPPYEAVWTNGGREAEKVLGRVIAIYREAGLAPGDEFKERADYIGAELDYLGQMASREAEAWESGDMQAAMETVAKEAVFARSMSNWVSRFVAEAIKFAQTDMYRGHLQMVKGFLADEVERLEDLIEETKYMLA